jgi:hypothetical protein
MVNHDAHDRRIVSLEYANRPVGTDEQATSGESLEDNVKVTAETSRPHSPGKSAEPKTHPTVKTVDYSAPLAVHSQRPQFLQI